EAGQDDVDRSGNRVEQGVGTGPTEDAAGQRAAGPDGEGVIAGATPEIGGDRRGDGVLVAGCAPLQGIEVVEGQGGRSIAVGLYRAQGPGAGDIAAEDVVGPRARVQDVNSAEAAGDRNRCAAHEIAGEAGGVGAG